MSEFEDLQTTVTSLDQSDKLQIKGDVAQIFRAFTDILVGKQDLPIGWSLQGGGGMFYVSIESISTNFVTKAKPTELQANVDVQGTGGNKAEEAKIVPSNVAEPKLVQILVGLPHIFAVSVGNIDLAKRESYHLCKDGSGNTIWFSEGEQELKPERKREPVSDAHSQFLTNLVLESLKVSSKSS